MKMNSSTCCTKLKHLFRSKSETIIREWSSITFCLPTASTFHSSHKASQDMTFRNLSDCKEAHRVITTHQS